MISAVTQNYICCVEFPFQVLFSSSPSSCVLSLYILPSFLKSSPRFSTTRFLTACLGYKWQWGLTVSLVVITHEKWMQEKCKSCILPSLIPNNSFFQPLVSLGKNTQLKICHLAVSQTDRVSFPLESTCHWSDTWPLHVKWPSGSPSTGEASFSRQYKTLTVKSRLQLLEFLVRPHHNNLTSNFQDFYLPNNISWSKAHSCSCSWIPYS